jgi:hypothetical protein
MDTHIDIPTMILRTLVEDVPRNLARFDEETGRFLTEGGWAVTNQDLVYPLALLYQAEHPDNPYFKDNRILAYAQRGGDAWRDFQYPDGKVEFIKVDDSTWGPIYMPWSMYHWVETYALLRDELGDERRARWEEGLTLAYDGIAEGLASGHVHNIPTWNGMATFRAGQIFDRSDWREAGRRMIHLAVEDQQPGGYWLEHHGPTPSYNTVYVHAIGLYYFFAGDDSVLPCLERSTDFHIRYTYPDGRIVETIDGRVKYHDRVNVHGLSAFSLFPQGRRYVRFLLREWLAERTQHPLPHLTYNQTTSGPKIAGGEYGLSPRIAPVLHHFAQGPEAPIPQDSAEYVIHDEGHAILRRADGWFTCISGVVTPAVESRWGQDRQNYLSIWHEKLGLVAGGGNAKDQPAFSTFVVGADAYLPTAALLNTNENDDNVVLGYGGYDCRLTVSIEDAHRLRLTFAGPGDGDSVGQVQFKIHPGEPLHTATGDAIDTAHDKVELSAEAAGGWASHRGLRIHMPAGSRLTWPVSPFNPYAADGAGPLDEAAAVLAAPLQDGPVEVVLELS